MKKTFFRTAGCCVLVGLLAATTSGNVCMASAGDSAAKEPAVQSDSYLDLLWDRGDAVNIGDNYEWEGVVDEEDGTVIITGNNKLEWASDGVLEIPAEVSGKTVIGVAGYGWENNFGIMSPEVITTLKLPKTVTSIGGGTFSEFKNLQTVYLPDNPSFEMDSWSNPFEGCGKIETVYLGEYSLAIDNIRDSVKTLHYYEGTQQVTDGGCAQLTSITLPGTVTTFGWTDSPLLSDLQSEKPIDQMIVTATRNCPNLCIPVNTGIVWGIRTDYQNSGITQITIQLHEGGSNNAKDAFINCPNLKGIYITDPSNEFHSEDGVLWWNNDLYAYPAGKSTAGEYVVPEKTKCIYLYAFDSCKFTTVTFPENMNTDYYWDRHDTQANPRKNFLEHSAIQTLRFVPGSAPLDLFSTKEELAERLEINTSQIEFYLGNTYQINYELDGGTNDPANPASYRAGEDPVTLKNPKKEGYFFLGWKRNDVVDKYQNTTARSHDGKFQNYTFTACWGTELPFTDVQKGSWYQEYVENVYQKSIMTGLTKTEFGAGESLARAQFAVILHRMNGEPPVDYRDVFTDVPKGDWYTNAILWANSIEVVNGYSGTTLFGTADRINREQMAVMMYRYANYKQYDTSARADYSKFADAASVNDFAKEAMQWAVGSNIITGKNNGTILDPQGNANRAECAAIITRFLDRYEN